MEAQAAPDRPTGLAAASGDRSVALTWTDPSDSTITSYQYQVNHNDTSTGRLSGWSQWAAIPSSNSATTTHTFTGLNNGSEYRYKIRAVNANGQSKPAPAADPWYVSAIPAGPPARPTGLSAASGGRSVILSWTNPNNSTITRYEYQVNHNNTGSGKLTGWTQWTHIPGSGATTTTHTFSDLNNGSEYRYKIRSVKAGLEGQEDMASPPAPAADPWYVSAVPQGPEPLPVSKFWAVRVCDHTFKVRWERVSGATGYDLEIRGKNWKRLFTNKDFNGYQFNQWTKDATFRIRIRAVNAHGESEWRKILSVAPLCEVDGLQASYAANGDISVSWNAATRAESYNVNFTSDNGKSWQRMVSGLTATTYTFNKDPATLPYNPNFVAAVQSRKGDMTSQWRNASIIPDSRLTVDDATVSTATLTLTNYSGAWWYKRVAPSGDDTCNNVAAGTSTATLSSLNADTSYTYTAYDASGCESGDEIDSVTFITQLTVSNLDGDGSSNNIITSAKRWSAEFTTGSNPRGYTLQSVTTPLAHASQTTGTLAWAIHTSTKNSDNKDVPSDTVQATLTSGGTPTGSSYTNYTHTCSGSGCTLLPNTTYFLIASVDGGVYYWKYEYPIKNPTLQPSDNGWTIGLGWYSDKSNDTWGVWKTWGTDVGKFKVAATRIPSPPVSVSNLGEAGDGSFLSVGTTHTNTNYQRGTSFDTGSHSGGYTLDSVTLKFSGVSGSPGDLTVAIYLDSSGLPGSSQVELTGSNPTGAGDYSYTCSSSCNLDADETYHVVLSANSASGSNNRYNWSATHFDNQTNIPSDAGWEIGNVASNKSTGSWSTFGVYSGKLKVSATER